MKAQIKARDTRNINDIRQVIIADIKSLDLSQ